MSQQSGPSDPFRIGVFIDGSFWFHLTYYWLHHHPARTQLAIDGVRDIARWYASNKFQRPVDETKIEKVHYFQAISSDRPERFFNVLDRLGVIRHELSFDDRRKRAIGLKTEFALTCWNETADLDMVMLLTGDDDYEPLVERLVRDDCKVLIPQIDATFTDSRSNRRKWLITSPYLCDAATDAPTWNDLLDSAQVDGYPLASPFLIDDSKHTAPSRRSR